MPAYTGYKLASISDYVCVGRNKLISGVAINRLIQNLTLFLEACDRNNLKDSMQLALCPAEVIHLQNIPIREDDNVIKMLDTDEISKNIDIVDNIKVETLRFIHIKNYEMYNDYHFSILSHKELSFNDSQNDYLTIFVDDKFLDKNYELYNKNIMRLIFTCIDHFIANTSGITYDIFSEHPIISDEESSFIDLAPKFIFRNRLSTLDILFMSEYLTLMSYYLRKWFRLSRDEVQDLFKEFPIIEFIGDEAMTYILIYIFNSIEEYLNAESGEIEKILNCEYKVAECLRDYIMNKPYEDD